MYNMEIAEIFEQVQFTLCDHLRVPPHLVAATAELEDDLHIDSLDLAEICILLEDTFDVEIDAAPEFHTVFDIAVYLQRRAPFSAQNLRT